jgi:hypothetical protein
MQHLLTRRSRDLETYYKFDAYYSEYHMPTHHNRSSTFVLSGATYNLSPPMLNITTEPYSSKDRCYDGTEYSAAYILSRSICQPEKFYQWGFSFMLSFLFLLVTIILWIALYIVWLCTFKRGSEPAQFVFGSLKTAVQVSAAMDQAVDGRVTDMNNETLEKERRDRRVVVPLSEAQVAEEAKEPLKSVFRGQVVYHQFEIE